MPSSSRKSPPPASVASSRPPTKRQAADAARAAGPRGQPTPAAVARPATAKAAPAASGRKTAVAKTASASTPTAPGRGPGPRRSDLRKGDQKGAGAGAVKNAAKGGAAGNAHPDRKGAPAAGRKAATSAAASTTLAKTAPARAARGAGKPSHELAPESAPSQRARKRAAAKPATTPAATPAAAHESASPPAVEAGAGSGRPAATAGAPVAPPSPAPAAATAATANPLLALAVEHGVFVVVAVPAALGAPAGLGRVEPLPAPTLCERVMADDARACFTVVTANPADAPGASAWNFVTAFLPWADPVAGPLEISVWSASQRHAHGVASCRRYADLTGQELDQTARRFGVLLRPVVAQCLAADHPLRRHLEARSASPAASALQGHFDGVLDGLAHGWAWDRRRGGERLGIEIVEGDQVVARGTADRFRDDIHAAGIGDGCHHFRLRLSYELFDGREHVLSARVAADGALLMPTTVQAVLPSLPLPDGIDTMPRRVAVQLCRQPSPAPWLGRFVDACVLQETWSFEEARAALLEIVRSHGDHAVPWCKIGETHLLDGEAAAAREAYERAVACGGTGMWAPLGLGNCFRALGQPAEAAAAYRAALAAEPDQAAPRRRLAEVADDALRAEVLAAQSAGRHDEALRSLMDALVQRPDHPVALPLVASMLRPTGADASGEAGNAALGAAEDSRRVLDALLDRAERHLREQGRPGA